jgi:hypothetical protein
MTKASEFENSIAQAARSGDYLPVALPNWMTDLGIISGDLIISSKTTGTKSPMNKTDILIIFQKSPPLKISVKLSNADYYGNWYGHKRFLNEFGNDAFTKMTDKVTEWANQWAYHPNANIFVGVSISFGKRTGNTFIPFLNIFDSTDELIKIIAGAGQGDGVANCLYISDFPPLNISDFFNKLSPINPQAIAEKGESINIICRPVNPMTEGSNRGKNVYTKFEPFEPLENPLTIMTLSSLMQLGKFIQVEPNRLNHNQILNTLEQKYNIIIPRKQK